MMKMYSFYINIKNPPSSEKEYMFLLAGNIMPGTEKL